MAIPQSFQVELFLTPKDIMSRLKIGKQRATDYAKEMEHYRIGKLIRVPESAYLKWLETRKQGPTN